MLTAAEGWLIGERPLPGEPSSAKNKQGEEELKYYYSTLGAEVSLERMASLAKSRWAIEQFYEDGKGECGLSDYQRRRWEGLHRHLALSMLAYSFLMLHSSITTSVGGCCSSEGLSPSVRHTTLSAIHRQVLVWLLEDLVPWFIETERIKTFRPRRNYRSSTMHFNE